MFVNMKNPSERSESPQRPGPKPRNRVGERHGLLTLVAYDSHFKSKIHWKALCDCGNKTLFELGSHTKSCGCHNGRKLIL